MRTSLKQKQISIFTKILFIFMIVVFPLYFLNIQMNILGQKDVRKEIVESTQSKISFYIKILDKEFENIIKMEGDLVNNEYLRQLVFSSTMLDEYQKYKAMNSIRDALENLTRLCSYVTEASVYIPSTDKKITNRIIGDFNKDEFNSLKRLTVSDSIRSAIWNNDYYINVSSNAYNDSNDEEMNPTFIISVKISKAGLENTLKQISGLNEGGALLMGGNKHGLTITGNAAAEILEPVRDYLKKEVKSLEKNKVGTIEAGDVKYIIAYEKSNLINTALVMYTPEKKLLGPLNRYRNWFWAMSIFTAIIIALFSFWINGIITKPLDKLIYAFKKIEDGNLNIAVKYGSNDEFGFLYRQFNEMFNRVRMLIEQVYEQKIRARTAELKQLQYQINPHFLYNSLFIIQGLIKMQDSQCAMKMAAHMGSFYQYITRSSSEEVPLYKEISHVKDYAEIQSIRFANRIKTEFEEIPEGCANIMVPRLILQPIIENSYEHGLKSKVKGGILNVRMQRQEGFLKLFIEDNGEEMDDDKLEQMREHLSSPDQNIENTGLLNVHRRLQIKYGEESGILVSRGEMGGLCVEIRLALTGGNQ